MIPFCKVGAFRCHSIAIHQSKLQDFCEFYVLHRSVIDGTSPHIENLARTAISGALSSELRHRSVHLATLICVTANAMAAARLPSAIKSIPVSARFGVSSAVHIKIHPRPRNIAESREVLRVLQQYGEIAVYKHLKVSLNQ